MFFLFFGIYLIGDWILFFPTLSFVLSLFFQFDWVLSDILFIILLLILFLS